MTTRRQLLLASLLGVAATRARAQRAPGRASRAYGERAPQEASHRLLRETSVPQPATSRTPLEDLYGIITPAALHFESHHSGVPEIDPVAHELLVAGLVDRPLVFTLRDLLRMPAHSRIHFIECAGNTAAVYFGMQALTPQRSHGLLSCSEWTGVSLRTLLQEAGVQARARWIIAEGADVARFQRSLPLEKALDDVLVAYGQNGEALRPEQGYPLRLVVPGWEGSTQVKWLRRLTAATEPAMARDETFAYTDLQRDGKSRIFSFVMEAKSVITRPAGGQRLETPGYHEITGLAWSGRGRIVRVEVSTDGGERWRDAELQPPILPRALTRFRTSWRWNREDAVLQSRCTDDTGYRQPTREQLLAVRGPNHEDHYNGIKAWRVEKTGEVVDAG